MGIRPEDISLENKSEYAAEINVDLIENLGSEKILYSRLKVVLGKIGILRVTTAN